MDDGRDDEDCRRVHSAQLRFARRRVTIGEGVSHDNCHTYKLEIMKFAFAAPVTVSVVTVLYFIR